MWDYRRRLARKLKNLKKDMTQREFARKLGIGQASLNRFINCYQAASLDTLETMCKRLKIDIVELFVEEEERK